MRSNLVKFRIIIVAVCSMVLLGLISFLLLNYFTERGKYMEIDNFDDYYYAVPEKTRKNIFANLKDIIKINSSTDAPSSGAVIRDTEPYLYSYSLKHDGFVGSFVVDIPDIQQSYFVKFNYSDNPETVVGGYSVLIYCLAEDKMIYPDFDCKENLPFVTEEK